MKTSDHILNFGSNFNERLDKASLSFAMDYVNRGENSVALDTLFEYLYENEVSITADEFDEAILLAKKLNISEDDLAYLRELIAES
ncbi:MafI family immunity protein [Marinomonas profundimaris]|uniref:MafI family immunity protein n=1 Tax=Marinomonas profundimaris TaxID=1208321 RepID=W1RZA7_9GAMM|nr:MafI family immunity protein [Marinomonas profundimaris]ETI62145.1 hypothetical protein D104_02565 [Marinomonas profundimaris]